MAKKVKKVEATSVEKVTKEDVEDFVREILEQEGFPAQGWVRYVYFKNGCLYATDEIHNNTYVVWENNVYPVFKIESWEEYAYNIPVSLEEIGLSWESPMKDWISAYINDSFEEWALEDWL